MLVLPINATNRNASLGYLKTKNINFRGDYDWSKYENHDGSPIPEIEAKKYNLSREAEALEKMDKIAEAAEKWFDVANLCRQGGKERDAYLCETTARNLLRRLRK